MKNKNFLKKLTAGILGFVMTLGVGAAGYAASATETLGSSGDKATNGSFSTTAKYYLMATNSSTNYYLTGTTGGDLNKNASWGTCGTTKTDAYTFTLTGTPTSSGDATITAKTIISGTTYYLKGLTTGRFNLSTTSCNLKLKSNGEIYESAGSYRLRYNHNNGSGGFRWYNGTTGAAGYFIEADAGKTLDSISIKTAPTKVNYVSGDYFNPSGLVITRKYTDNTTEDLAYDGHATDFSFNPSLDTELTTSHTSVTITYNEKTVSQTIAVVADTNTYATYSKTNLTGTAPTGSSALYEQSYGTEFQMTGTNYIKYTIKGYKGHIIKKVVLSMHSNSSGGSGWMYLKAGSTTLASIGSDGNGIQFNNEAWYGSWSQTYVNVIVDLNNDSYVIQENEDIELYIKATANSLFCQSIKIGYEAGNIKTLSSIAVTTNPTKLKYSEGETFSTTGMVVTATYSNTIGGNTTAAVTGYTFSPNRALTSTDSRITISYTEGTTKTTTVDIDVAYFDSIKITSNATKTAYHDGEVFSVSGLVVKSVTKHSDGKTADEEVDITSSVTYKIGNTSATPGSTVVHRGETQTVTISYQGKTTSYEINCDYAYVQSISFGNVPSTLGPGGSFTVNSTISPETASGGYTVSISEQTAGLNVSLSDKTFSVSSNNTVSGSVTLLVTSTGTKQNGEHATDSATIAISGVEIPELDGFEISGTPTYPTQYIRDSLTEPNLDGLVITGTYTPESDNPETFDVDDFLWDMESYEHPYGIYLLDDNLDITVEEIDLEPDYCSTIQFTSTELTKKEYFVSDESFDHTGLSISGKMASEETAVIDTSLVSYEFAETPGSLGVGTGYSVSVTATYGTATATTNVSISEIKAVELDHITVTKNPTKMTYQIGQTFDSSGIEVTGYNNDGSEAGDFTDYCAFTLAEDAMIKEGNPTVTVTHNSSGKTTSFSITVEKAPIQTTVTWELVTAAPTDANGNVDWTGDYLVGNSSETGDIKIADVKNFAGGSEMAFADATITIVNSKKVIADISTDYAVHIQKSSTTSGKYAVIANGYYIGKNANSNGIDALATSSTYTSNYDNNLDYSSSKVSIAGNGSRVFTYYSQNSNFRYYASSNNCTQLFKKHVESSGTKELAGITGTYSHSGDTYYAGDEVQLTDFKIKLWYNDGSYEDNITSGFSITDPVLSEGNNSIELNYEDKTCHVAVNGIQARDATVTHVYVEIDKDALGNPKEYQKNYYKDGDNDLTWNLDNIVVVAYWSDDSVNKIALQELINKGDAELSVERPDIGVESFSVTGTYFKTAIDSNHNTVSGFSVVAKAIQTISWTNRFDGVDLNVFAGSKINKNDFVGGSGSLTAKYNDGTDVAGFSINDCTVALYKRINDKNVKQKDVTFDENGDYTFAINDNGCYFLLTSSGKTTQYSKDYIFHVVESLNPIIKTGDGITSDFTLSSASSVTQDGITVTFNQSDGTNPPAWYDAGLRLYSDNTITVSCTKNISKIEFIWEKQGSKTFANLTSNVGTYVHAESSGDTGIWTGSNTSITFTVGDGQLQLNTFTVYVGDSQQEEYHNKKTNVQEAVINYVKDNIGYLDTSNWSTASSNFSSMLSTLSESADQTLARNMLMYATAKTGDDSDVVQQFVKLYDEVFALNDMADTANFLGRARMNTVTVTINYYEGSQETIIIIPGQYELPSKPSKSGFTFDGWDIGNGVIKQPGDTIEVSENITITAVWSQSIEFSSSVAFKFTGLEMGRLQLIFEGSCPEGIKNYGFLVTTNSEITLTELTTEQVQNGVQGVSQVNGKNKCVLGTDDADKTVSVVFYYIDSNNVIHYSEVITMSFNSYVTEEGYNPADDFSDEYAIACLEYYIYCLQNTVQD